MQNAQPSSDRPILFALGGTGGHLLPAASLARGLKKEGQNNLLFAGSGLATNPFFEKEEFAYRQLSASTPFSKKPVAAARAVATLFRGIVEALSLIRESNPRLVVGFGSFHAFPLMVAARLKKVPYILFEPNAFLGRVNRLFAKRAHLLALQFEEAKEGMATPHALIEFPIIPRPEAPSREEALNFYGLDPELDTLLIMGGSQGAGFLNEALPSLEVDRPFQVIHLVGPNGDLDAIRERWKKRGTRCSVLPFEKEMERVYAAADGVICRSGAGTLSELVAYELPSLLIPYPFSYLHQMKNARLFEQMGAALIFDQNRDAKELLGDKITHLLAHCRSEMKQNLKKFKREEGRRSLVNIVLEELEKL
ncbi:MAG: UDP-N-acetylglucosamine--N-acetylmuramyl-(pentapeptide) pyrophosphoryl-undecaprenol N-acetylglucosamine transferase [Chlamydiae bacterium]|nr:UDP-N-acetylglucosamine--N-acetylmuramyl-(pentapeptide) pyrophosphoryl-undecaprenol N-acetylglucosamine transferase [Chlamydiota bacterium]